MSLLEKLKNENHHQIYLALGSNLKNPITQLEKALFFINNSPNLKLIQYSSIYQSPPFDNTNQPDYFNLVCEVGSSLNSTNLLKFIKKIEKKMARAVTYKWGPRIIDIDILLFDDFNYQDNQLTIPHQGLKVRNFFLKPLIELVQMNGTQDLLNSQYKLKKLKSYLDKTKGELILIKSIPEIKKSIAIQLNLNQHQLLN